MQGFSMVFYVFRFFTFSLCFTSVKIACQWQIYSNHLARILKPMVILLYFIFEIYVWASTFCPFLIQFLVKLFFFFFLVKSKTWICMRVCVWYKKKPSQIESCQTSVETKKKINFNQMRFMFHVFRCFSFPFP